MPIVYHNHHIIPKHMGGSDDPSNLVKFTIKEHALAHKKLWEEFGKEEDEIAYRMLSGQITITEAKLRAKLLGAIRGGKISGNNRRGQKCSEQACKNMSIGRIGMKLTESHISNVVNKVSKNWEFISPSGELFIIKNKAEFCRENNLTPNLLTLVAQGKQTHHKGWKCRKL